MKFFPCFMVDCGAYREYTEEEAISIVPRRCRRCSSWKGFDFHTQIRIEKEETDESQG